MEKQPSKVDRHLALPKLRDYKSSPLLTELNLLKTLNPLEVGTLTTQEMDTLGEIGIGLTLTYDKQRRKQARENPNITTKYPIREVRKLIAENNTRVMDSHYMVGVSLDAAQHMVRRYYEDPTKVTRRVKRIVEAYTHNGINLEAHITDLYNDFMASLRDEQKGRSIPLSENVVMAMNAGKNRLDYFATMYPDIVARTESTLAKANSATPPSNQ